MRGPHVVVIGGGLAGTAAALACADAGARVSVLEKRRHLGGLTWSFEHDGLNMDNGQHVFLRCCTAYLDFLDRIGSAGDVELQDRLDVTVLRPRKARGAGVDVGVLRRDGARPPLHLARSLAGYRLVPWAQRSLIGPAVLALSRLDLDDPQLDQETFGEWLRRHRQGREAVPALWDLICLPTVNLPAAKASLAMAAKVFQTGLLREAPAADIGWSRVPLGVLHGQRSTSALRKAGAEVHLFTTVQQVQQVQQFQQARQLGAGPGEGANGTGGPRFRVVTTAGAIDADAVVAALPHYCAEDVLPGGALGECRPSQLGSSPIVNVHVQFDRKVMGLPFAASVGTVAQWIFDRTEPSGAERGQCLAVSISAADDCMGARPDDLAGEVTGALRRLFPRARDAKVLRCFVTKERQATFRAVPGSSFQRAHAGTAYAGLAVAGAWTATGWPPTMESAVRSGALAARAALAGIGQQRGLPPLPGAVNRSTKV